MTVSGPQTNTWLLESWPRLGYHLGLGWLAGHSCQPVPHQPHIFRSASLHSPWMVLPLSLVCALFPPQQWDPTTLAHGWVLPESAARHGVELLLFSCIPGPRNLGQCLVWWWQTARCQRHWVGFWLIVPSRPRSLGVEPSVSSTDSGLERVELVGNLLLKLYSGLANRPHQPFFLLTGVSWISNEL